MQYNAVFDGPYSPGTMGSSRSDLTDGIVEERNERIGSEMDEEYFSLRLLPDAKAKVVRGDDSNC